MEKLLKKLVNLKCFNVHFSEVEPSVNNCFKIITHLTMPFLKIRFYLLFAAILILLPRNSISQELLKKTTIIGKIGTIISSGSTTPFLLRSNQYGLVPTKSGIGYLNISLNKDYDSLYTINKKLKRFGYGYGLEVHTNLGKSNQFLLPVAYAKIRYGAFEFYGGRRREIQGLVDTLGTMGSYIWSGNALPMPKLEISIPTYTPIMNNGLIAIKGNFAHGWFGKGDSVQNVWLHQKSFYARIGKPNWKVHMIGGFNHQVQWAGYPTKPFYDEPSDQTISRFSTDFTTYIQVISGVSLNNKGQGAASGAPVNEALNRAGNHLGSLDIGLHIGLSHYKILAYRQSFFEDGSLFYLNNIRDGLYGLSISTENKIITKLCLEYLDTRSQGGELFEWTPELRGRDNYFNNSLYRDAWTYKEQTIGNPMISTDRIQSLNTINYEYPIVNNRLTAISLHIFYTLLETKLRSQLISSKNLGNYDIIFDKPQLYFLQHLERTIMGYQSKISVSGDIGDLWPKNFGGQLTISKKLK